MVIEKIIIPSNISHKEEYATVWIADLESGKQAWVQTSKDKEHTKWIRIGDLYEHFYLHNINEELEDTLISFYKNKNIKMKP